MRESIQNREGAVMLNDEGMSDEIVIGSLVFNKDGSITVSALVQVYHPDGRKWATNRQFRIPREK